MRPDVKLGVIISLAVVLVAGGYYLYRDSQGEPIPMSLAPAHVPGNAQSPSPAQKAPTKPAQREKRLAKKGLPGKARGSGGGKMSRIVKKNELRKKKDARKEPAARNTLKSTARKKPEPTTVPARSKAEDPVKIARSARSGGAARAAPGKASAAKPAGENVKSRANRPRVDPEAAPKMDKTPRRVASARKQASPTRLIATSPPKKPMPSESSSPHDDTLVAVDKHKVQAGDSFASIAVMYYGHEKYTRLLAEGNPQIKDPRRLRVGHVIKIPALSSRERSTASARSTAIGTSPPAERRPVRTYRVKPGDSFYAIARRELGDASRWEELLALNKDLVGGDPRKLQPGQVITFPNG